MGYLTYEGPTFVMEVRARWEQCRADKVNGHEFTQEKLAERMRVDVHTLTDMLNGNSLPRKDTLARFCKEVGVDETQQHHWEQLLRREKEMRRTPPQTVGFLYAGVEDAAHFWYRAAMAIAKSVDDENLLRLPGTDTPQYGVTAFCHKERKSLMLAHLRYFRKLGNALAGLVIAPAYGVGFVDNQNDRAVVDELDYFLRRNIRIVFIDRKMLVGGGPSQLTDRIATDVGEAKGIKLVGIDGYAAGQMAANKLLEERHKPEKIAIAGDILQMSTIYERWLGASDVLRPLLAPGAKLLQYFGTEYADSNYGQRPFLLNEVVEKVLKGQPTGIVALTSQLAILIRAEVQRRQEEEAKNILVPVIVSLDDVPELGTTADIPRYPYSPWILIERAIQTLRQLDVNTTISFNDLRGAVKPPMERR